MNTYIFQIETSRKQLEIKFEKDVGKIAKEHKEKVHQMSLAHASEMIAQKKKVDVAETK